MKSKLDFLIRRINSLLFRVKNFQTGEKGKRITSIDFDIDLSLLPNLPNEIKYGGGTEEKDSKNRPRQSLYYQRRYRCFNADFIKGDSNKIYLTLDEGYENGYSSAVLDVLKKKQVSAVFFVTMGYAQKPPKLVRRMINEGHIVGAHSITHPADGMPNLSIERQLAEMRELHEYVKREYDYEMYLFRYPAGIFSEQSLVLMKTIGYRSVFWSFCYLDWMRDAQADPAEALKLIMSQLHPGAIYLLHAMSSTNAQIMEAFIDQVRAAGYEFSRYE